MEFTNATLKAADELVKAINASGASEFEKKLWVCLALAIVSGHEDAGEVKLKLDAM